MLTIPVEEPKLKLNENLRQSFDGSAACYSTGICNYMPFEEKGTNPFCCMQDLHLRCI